MYKKIEPNNKIFKCDDFKRDKYKFNIVSKILSSNEALLYSDEENYFFARSQEGEPTWIWTKDGLKDKKILDEIKEIINLYLTDLNYDQFTCKKELYDYLKQTNYERINKEDYFELGFFICNKVKNVKQVNGHIELAIKEDSEILSEFILKFKDFMNKTLKSNNVITIEKAREETNKLIESNSLYCWKNNEEQIVCIARYVEKNGVARIGHVYTLEEERGKGYAANLIHDLTEKLLSVGLKPLLYTDYSYPASNKAYINAGYEYKGILIKFSCSKNK